ncbi:superoxide dismutase family protein [Francisella tularensis subsp. novicida]|uniref:Superoxide dismutase [Cu-Zn] n=2 Tax=Francisella tularensis TaxID=263 RepID=A0A6I4RVY9_FRATU|nr:superoxide dismutase family protein [Francisella tularensis]ABK89308.1 superoxide dismutase (Cu-Zn) precusor [Francisella tularensis subsp. novicida U112]AJI61113.1 superoxide dismutase Cu-Zn [Francisella tularensis subsp. novicida U112]EDX19178.1 copper/zinc superoxide dismutase [Francisella tularensis subsp. novicida FTE]MBK2035696.1 superoxide dismutase family protein [Francisella tularensis subsp. novicida]MBK2115625.1 superoxide dismutase family protein [Francisella tularensis subsp. n
MTAFYKLCGISMLSLVLADCTFLSANKPYDRTHDNELIVHMKDVNTHKEVGTITISPYIHDGNQEGMLITPHLYNLPANTTHGMHIHINPSCEDNGMAAGGHWDPDNTQKHLGPYNDNGHKGDLPVLVVNADGTATEPVVAPKLNSLEELAGHSLMLHAGGDNYSDKPQPLGGGGARMWCGVISD